MPSIEVEEHFIKPGYGLAEKLSRLVLQSFSGIVGEPIGATGQVWLVASVIDVPGCNCQISVKDLTLSGLVSARGKYEE